MAPALGSGKRTAPDHWLHTNILHVYPGGFSWVGSQGKEAQRGKEKGSQSILKGSRDDMG